MPRIKTKKEARLHRSKRIRRRVVGTAEKPRLTVFRSLNHIYVQAIDDASGKTLLSASSQDEELKNKVSNKTGNKSTAKAVGELVASRLKAKGIEQVVFDRAGYLYHGRVKALAEAAREAGLKF